MRAIVLVTDAYGGRGGIALYNRNLLKALCQHPQIDSVIAIPRVATYDLEELPQKLNYVTAALGSKLKYLLACLRISFSREPVDIIVCSHLHLLPFAFLLKLTFRCPVIPVIYGVEAWTPTPHWIVNRLCRTLKAFISIREWTARRFIDWAGLDHARFFYLPNCIDESKYSVAQKRSDLLEQYGIKDKTVIMTSGRMDEKRKGFDEIIEVLSYLRKRVPNVAYLIWGDGTDMGRLKKKAEELGVRDIVIFTGYVPDEEKADHYRLADVFAMPGSDKAFDRYPYRFVFLEALACGIPVVGSRLEDASEANDPYAKLIIQVDPNDKDNIVRGVMEALSRPRGKIQSGLENFFYSVFESRLHGTIDQVVGKG